MTYLEAVLYNTWNYKWTARYIFSWEHAGQATFIIGLPVSRDGGRLVNLALRAAPGPERGGLCSTRAFSCVWAGWGGGGANPLHKNN